MFRQRYLAIEGTISVRVRDAGYEGCTLTVKAGTAAVRTQLEWHLDREQFEAVLGLTEGRRVCKTRHHVPIDGYELELEVFADNLEELVSPSSGSTRIMPGPPSTARLVRARRCRRPPLHQRLAGRRRPRTGLV